MNILVYLFILCFVNPLIGKANCCYPHRFHHRQYMCSLSILYPCQWLYHLSHQAIQTNHRQNSDRRCSTYLDCADHTHSPEWNSPEVIRAMLSVLTEAVKDENCERYVRVPFAVMCLELPSTFLFYCNQPRSFVF
jgi:hypothetical protein